jgi:hypothetical protein
MNRLSRLIGVTFLLFCTLACNAQITDTVKTENGKVIPTGKTVISDSSKVKAPAEHSPKKAVIYSAILPGLGQAYNHKYWKMPIVYAAFAGIGYAIYKNNGNYQTFRKAYLWRVDDDPSTVDNYQEYSATSLKQERDYWHRYRDLSIVGAVAIYTLQIVDAAVDAHLYKFDEKLNGDLSISVRPQPCMGIINGKNVSGLKLSIHF